MYDSFLYSSNDVAIVTHCHTGERQHSSVSSESEAWLSFRTSMALAPEYGLTFPWKCMC